MGSDDKKLGKPLKVRKHWEAVVRSSMGDPSATTEVTDLIAAKRTGQPVASDPEGDATAARELQRFVQDCFSRLQLQIAELNAVTLQAIGEQDSRTKSLEEPLSDSAVPTSKTKADLIQLAEPSVKKKTELMQPVLSFAILASLLMVVALQLVLISRDPTTGIAESNNGKKNEFQPVSGDDTRYPRTARDWVLSPESSRIVNDVDFVVELMHHYPNDFRKLHSQTNDTNFRNACQQLRTELVNYYRVGKDQQ